MTAPEQQVEVRRYDPALDGQSELKAEWKRFVAESNNGTLFHDLDFLAYHGPDRFETHHLMLYQAGKLVGVFPAALVQAADGAKILTSPYGASVGGLVMPPRFGAKAAVSSIEALQKYVSSQGWSGIETRIGPSIYLRTPDDLPSFSLMVCGFKLEHRWLSMALPIQGDADEEGGQSKRQARYVRAALKAGLVCSEAAPERLSDFYKLLLATWATHDATPTHTEEELRRIFELVPGRLRLFFGTHENKDITATLVFMLNSQVAYTFYLCKTQEQLALRGNAVLVSHVMEKLAAEGYRYLDMGPSASDKHFNEGVIFFKEGLGAHGYCRDTWIWRA